jgi:SAM-dependent methyltransferase
VLEVGCGRGGGAAYMLRYLRPASLTGIDLAANAVAFCRRRHCLPCLTFASGDAEAMPFASGSYDVIVNVESSHCYGSMERFLCEVQRVLRPGGYFLFTDHRSRDRLDTLRWQFRSAGLEPLGETDITPNVLRALDLDNDRKLALIRRKAPPLISKRFQQFAGIRGTKTYEAFKSGELIYMSFTLRRR